MILRRASAITKIPAVLKNVPLQELLEILREPKESRANIGNVPNAKINIIMAPSTKLPVVKTYTCIYWVNPHGKKKVPTPNNAGAK